MNRISDSQLTQAAAIVRNSMLMALDQAEIPTHNFSSEFELRIQALRKQENHRQAIHNVMRRCVAAILAFIMGTGIFLSVNVEARAAVIAWIKEVFEDRIEYWFTGDSKNEFPEYDLTWVPDNMECIYDEFTEYSRSVVYMNPVDPQRGFTLTTLDELRQNEGASIAAFAQYSAVYSHPDLPGFSDKEVKCTLLVEVGNDEYNVTTFANVEDSI